MTAVQQLWIASIFGAGVFFAAGFIVMALRARGRSSPAAQPELAAPEVERLGRELAGAQHQLSAAEAERATLASAHAALKQEHASLAARLERAQAQPAPAAKVTEIVRPDPAVVREVERLQAHVRETEQAAAERTNQVRELTSQIEVLQKRAAEADAMRADYLRLRTSATEMEFMTQEVERLRVALKAAKSAALGGTPRAARTPQTNGSKLTAESGSITEALSSAIERFSDSKMRSVAIADSAGFPVSSFGDDAIELAAYAALLHEVGARATQFLPVGVAASMEFVDEHGARISVWPFEVGSDRLLAVNLAVSATDAERVEALVSDVTSILAPASATSRTGSA
ncbi:MAG: hypothetical protein R3B48_20695 [Kofleriaceae bacterium]